MLARLKPESLQVRLVGIEGGDLSFQGTEPTGVLLMRQRDELLHGGWVEQVGITAVRLET